MKRKRISFELPEETLALPEVPEDLGAAAKEAFVMRLVRDAVISQGKAAELLGINRWDMFELSAKYQIPAGPVTPDEIEAELATIRKLSGKSELG